MRIFACSNCGQAVYFDDRLCVQCGLRLGFSPEALEMVSLEPENDVGWRSCGITRRKRLFCANATIDVCNWLVEEQDGVDFCLACRHNRLIPNIQNPDGIRRWQRLSYAQRHLFYSILRWDIPHPDRVQDPSGGLVFDFLEDAVGPNDISCPALTGHKQGVIAIRVAEADDVVREAVRVSLHEPYRTLLGHFRHEMGHFIWTKLVLEKGNVDQFREVFGDERTNYQLALEHLYREGPRNDWRESFISTYASSHPWEDFAECFAHLVHVVDSLETAAAYGLTVGQRNHVEMTAEVKFDPYRALNAQQLTAAWVPMSIAINSVQRSMGQPDAYPFVISTSVIAKLDFLNRLVTRRFKWM